MQNFLPSKQFLGIAAPFLVGIAITFTLIYLSFPSEAERAVVASDKEDILALATEALMREHFKDVDSDGDGLFDWEEALWETDPFNPDTSGDGMSDGEAVKQGRDPLVAGPENWLVDTRGFGGAASGTSTDPDQSRSERFAHQFLSSYLQLKQAGQLSQASKDRLLNNLVLSSTIDFSLGSYIPSTTFDTYQSPQEPERLAYYRELESIYQSLSKPRADDLLLLYQNVSEPGSDALERLAQNIAFFDSILDSLLAAQVPKDALAAHTRLTNALSQYRSMVDALSKQKHDPLTSILALQRYEQVIAEVEAASHAMQKYFADNGYLASRSE